ncbi:ATP-dependent DNA helicase RecQ [Heyndrickxia sporothermodurans]|nr:ATP-dependent DNA helicase RecQ [Heyndrickxia sporothermodurans]
MLKLDIKRQKGVKTMTFLQALLLINIKKINGSRTIYSIYHLVKGKKSSQTIQDCHFFKIGVFFQTYPSIERNEFNELILDLVKKEFISQLGENQFFITELGEKELTLFFQQNSFPKYMNGLKYQDIAIAFWKRISLLTQVLSNAVHDVQKYYPVQREEAVQEWVKSFLRAQKFNKTQLATALYSELNSLFLNENASENPEIFIIRLTGNGQFGKTIDQAADHFLMEYTEYWYRFVHLLHFMLEMIIFHYSKYPLLYSIISDIHHHIAMTNSSKETLLLLNKGHSISEVALMRRLKKSTIEDHIIEIVLNDPNFDISPYIEKEDVHRIISTAKIVKQKKLKAIKERIEHVSYFQIRLVLAKQGVWQ